MFFRKVRQFKNTRFSLCIFVVLSLLLTSIPISPDLQRDSETGQISVTRTMSIVHADSEGANYPGTCVEQDTGNIAFTGDNNGTTSDDLRLTTGTMSSNGDISNNIYCSDFGFSIPTAATIDGIQVEVEVRATAATRIETNEIALTTDGAASSTPKSGGARYGTTDAFESWGGASDMWGESYTATDVNDSNFGVIMSMLKSVGLGSQNGQMDTMRITVTYTDPSSAGQEWNTTDWDLYDTITIDASNIDATLTDFPVYVDLSELSSSFWGVTPTSSERVGADIRVTNNANTELPRELVSASSTLQTGELHFKADSISSTTDTVFKIWYNGTTTSDYSVTATSGAQNVWTNDYFLVYHMNEDPALSSVEDSTGNSTNGSTAGSMTSEDLVDGKLGDNFDFDGTGDRIITGEIIGDYTSVTLSSWIDLDSYTGDAGLIFDAPLSEEFGVAVSDNVIYPQESFSLFRGFDTTDGRWHTATGTLATGSPQFVAMTMEDMSDVNEDPLLYINAVSETVIESDTPSGTHNSKTSDIFRIGAGEIGALPIDGEIDELRFSSTTRSASWIKAEYTNQATTSDFYTVNTLNGIISYIDSSSQDGTLGSCSPTIPADAQEGDFMIVFASRSFNDPGGIWDDDGGGGNGWTQLDYNRTTSGRDIETAIYYKTHSGSESTPTFTASTTAAVSSACGLSVYRGVDTSSPFDVTYSSGSHFSSGTNNSTPDAPDITTETDGAVALTMHILTAAEMTTPVAPGGYPLRVSVVGGNRNLFIADQEITLAGSETIDTWNHDTTGDNGEYHVYTLALRPESNAAAWNTTDWASYTEITVDPTNINETLYDFPVYVDLADLGSDFWSGINEGGGDIRITTGGPGPITELAREVVSADTYTKTGQLHFKAPQIQRDIETTFRLYYNGTTTDDYLSTVTYGAQNVWTNEYLAVWHLEDEPSQGIDATRDSTHNNFDARTVGSMGAEDMVAAALGNGYDLDASNDGATVDEFSIIPTAGISYSAWGNPRTTGENNQGRIVSDVPFTSASGTELSFVSSGEFAFRAYYTTSNGVWETTDNVAALGDSTYIVGQHADLSDTSVDAEIYVDGQPLTITESTSPSGSFAPRDTDTNVNIGNNSLITNTWDGSLDEVRISSTTRSSAWIYAEYINQSTSTDFYSTTSNSVGFSLSNHDVGQVNNTFSFANETDAEFFAFNLNPSASVTVTNLTLLLTGVQNVTDSEISDFELYEDVNDNATYDSGTDTLIGSGSLIIADQTGTIDFATDFSLAASTNYIVIGHTTSIDNGDFVTFTLSASDITSAVIATGTVSSIQHRRNNSGGGGGGAAAVGDEAPVGDGDVGGGTNEGGEQIGNDPDFFWPTADSGSWTTAANAYDQTDGTYATAASSVAHEFTDFNHSVPGSDTINGIEVKLEVSGTTAAGDIGIELSWDNGSSFTTTGYTTGTLTDTDTVVTLGGASDLWGRSWSATELSNVNFSVRTTANPSSNTVQIDAIQVKVHHQASGGGGGGGGAI